MARGLAALSLVLGTGTHALAEQVTVAVTAIVEHPALDSARQGILDGLAAEGFVAGDNLNFQFESAQGSPVVAAQIAQKFVGETPDVIVPISTPSAQAVAAATEDIPIVFCAVTDPVGAKLVGSLDQPGGNITGTSDLSPINAHLGLIKEISAEVDSLGVIYNPGEVNAVTLVGLLREEAPGHGIEITEVAATRSADVASAAQSLVGKVDAIYATLDNTVITALEAIIAVGIENQLPVHAADTDSVARGAIAALGFDYYDVGVQTGHMVADILRGQKPADRPVERVQITELHINPGAASRMGVRLPDTVLAR
ncbi:MAG: ABC transporter substrate-binding protein, partial [Pseudomonadota bacterium]